MKTFIEAKSAVSKELILFALDSITCVTPGDVKDGSVTRVFLNNNGNFYSDIAEDYATFVERLENYNLTINLKRIR